MNWSVKVGSLQAAHTRHTANDKQVVFAQRVDSQPRECIMPLFERFNTATHS